MEKFNFIKIINMKTQPSYKLILKTFGEMCIYFSICSHFSVINVIDKKSQKPSQVILAG